MEGQTWKDHPRRCSHRRDLPKTWISTGSHIVHRHIAGIMKKRIGYTIARWRKCHAIKDGIERLQAMLADLLESEQSAALKLDAIPAPLSLLLDQIQQP